MALIPRHEPDPNISNPFALRYFWAFLRRNWLVWLLLAMAAALLFVRFQDELSHVPSQFRVDLQGVEFTRVDMGLATRPATNPTVVFGPAPESNPTLAIVDLIAPYTPKGLAWVLLWSMNNDSLISAYEARSPNWGFIADVSFVASPDGTRGYLSASITRDLRAWTPSQVILAGTAIFLGFADWGGSVIAEVDLKTGEIISNRAVSQLISLECFGPDGKTIFGDGSNHAIYSTLLAYHIETGEIETIPLGGSTFGLLPDGSIGVSAQIGGEIFAYNPVTKTARPYTTILEEIDSRQLWQGARWNQLRQLQIQSASFKDPNLAPNETPPHYWMLTPPRGQNDYYTSSTHPLAFVGNDLLMELRPDGLKLEDLDEVLKREPLRSYDPNDVLNR